MLSVLKNTESKLILSSDSHTIATLDFYFKETEQLLKDVGFEYVYALDKGEFKKIYL